MNRTITIDVDTGQVTTTGNWVNQVATGTINHALDMARSQHD